MVDVRNNDIRMTRGDTAILNLRLYRAYWPECFMD